MSLISTVITLKDLPPPPAGKTGWPWTETTKAISEKISESSECPAISIVTPNYNYGQFLEETIRSVLLQGYPNLEYIIIDGKSTDCSVEIINKYEKYITYWISESDNGQTDAINKGLKQCTGEIWSYLNSDDLLYPDALNQIVKCFKNGINWLGGVSTVFSKDKNLGMVIPKKPKTNKEYLSTWNRQAQYVFPCSNVCFMSRKILETCGLFDSSYEYSMDIEYYARAIFEGGFEPFLISDVLGGWRWHQDSKTFNEGLAYGFRKDEVKIAQQYLTYLPSAEAKILEQEIKYQQRWLVCRKAIFNTQQGKIKQSLLQLLSNVYKHPQLLKFRPWYGALKKSLFAKYKML